LGKVPVKLVRVSVRSVKLTRAPICDGMEPVSDGDSIDNNCRLVSDPMTGSIVPVSVTLGSEIADTTPP